MGLLLGKSKILCVMHDHYSYCGTLTGPEMKRNISISYELPDRGDSETRGGEGRGDIDDTEGRDKD